MKNQNDTCWLIIFLWLLIAGIILVVSLDLGRSYSRTVRSDLESYRLTDVSY